jgi:tetratricopeptide (TPR) repeat protein
MDRCRRFAAALVFSAMLALISASAQAQSLKDWKCTGNPDIPRDEQIAGCTRAIGSAQYTGRDLAAAFINRGNVYAAARDIDRALADYSKAIELDPNEAKAFSNRGAAYQAEGEIERAFADYDEAIRLNPNGAAAFNNRGIAYQAQGDLDRAIADYGEAIRLNPKNAFAFNNRGRAYAMKKDYDRAIAECDQAIALDPGAQSFNNRGNVYLDKGDPDRAIADYTEAIRLKPNYAPALFWRGKAKQLKGDNAGADADIAAAKKIDPNNPASH